MAVFVNLVFSVVWSDEGHFGNKDLCSIHVGAIIKPFGGRVTGISDQWDSDFVSHIGTGEFYVANLVARQVSEFRSQFLSSVPNDKSERWNRVSRRARRND